jgi:flagellar assembly protein FliH
VVYKSPVIKSKFLQDLEAPGSKLIRYFEDQKKAVVEEIEEDDGKNSPEKAEQDEAAEDNSIEVAAEMEKLKEEAAQIIEQASQQAEDELKKARDEAEKILGEAKKEISRERAALASEREKALTQSHREGFEKGFSEGVDKGLDETREMIRSASTVLGELKARKGEILTGSLSQVVQLSLAVARKVIRCETRINPQIVVRAVREASNHINSSDNIRILVSREDLPAAEDARNQFLDILKGSPEIGISSDSTITRGGCIIETSMGNLDAQVETSLEIIEREFERMLQSNDDEIE